jgi:hypothetical protein
VALKHQKAAEVAMAKRGLKCIAIRVGYDGIETMAAELRAQGVRTHVFRADDFTALYISEVA